jgi:hypothetical protein
VKESRVQDLARLALSRAGAVCFRNNVGTAEHWTERGVQRVEYGLAKGSADLVGLVGGRFFAVEIKAHAGRVAPEQEQWLALVRRSGGFAAVLRGPREDDDAGAAGVARECAAMVERCRAGASQ